MMIEFLSQLLEPTEREAVLGDLAEAGKSRSQTLRDLLGLIVRRQAPAWKPAGAWLVLLGVVIPLAVLINISAGQIIDSVTFRTWMGGNIDRGSLREAYWIAPLVRCAELACWSWTAGIVVGAFSRRTTIINSVLFCALTIVGTLIYGPPFLPSEHAFAMLMACIAAQLTRQASLVVTPAFAGVRQRTSSTIFILAAATLLLMPIHELFGIVFTVSPKVPLRHAGVGLACYFMLWPILFWLVSPFFKRRAAAC